MRQHVRPHVGALVVEPVDDDAGELGQALDGAALRRHDVERARGDVMPDASMRGASMTTTMVALGETRPCAPCAPRARRRRLRAAAAAAVRVTSSSAASRGVTDGAGRADDESSSSWSSSGRAPRVLFENAHVVIINKYPNTSFHSEFEPGVVATVRALRATEGIEGEVFGVHRLDKHTSGILILAKTKAAASALSKAFEERKIVKYYVGVSVKKPKKKMGTVEGDMTRSRSKAWMLTRSTSRASAVTKFVSFGARGANGAPRRMFIFKPLTGKTHQLRVAAKSLGAALLGDDIYSSGAGNESATAPRRLYLHAAAIRIPSLYDGFDAIQVICDPSDDGDEWDAEAFSTHFPPELARDFGEWFPDSPLLRSALIDL